MKNLMLFNLMLMLLQTSILTKSILENNETWALISFVFIAIHFVILIYQLDRI